MPRTTSFPHDGEAVPQFNDWARRWIELATYQGRYVPDVEERIDAVIALWHEPVPTGWKRKQDARLLDRSRRYTRGNGGPGDLRRGEHAIEYDILDPAPATTTTRCLGGALVDGINAVPLSRDLNGGRTGNVEADMLLLVDHHGTHRLVLVEAKNDSNTAWYAAVENLRQAKLLSLNTAPQHLFHTRCPELDLPRAMPTTSITLAPEAFYTAPGAKSAAVGPAEELLHRMSEAAGIHTALATWDPTHRTIAYREPGH